MGTAGSWLRLAPYLFVKQAKYLCTPFAFLLQHGLPPHPLSLAHVAKGTPALTGCGGVAAVGQLRRGIFPAPCRPGSLSGAARQNGNLSGVSQLVLAEALGPMPYHPMPIRS